MLSRSGWLWLNFVIIPASCNLFLENIIHREKKLYHNNQDGNVQNLYTFGLNPIWGGANLHHPTHFCR